jgi:hypothetical protein
LAVVLHGLRSTVKLRGAAGTVGTRRKRSPFVVFDVSGGSLQPGDSVGLTLQFSGKPNHFTISVLANATPA